MRSLIFLLLSTTVLQAQDLNLPQATSPTVNDFADYLSADQEQRLSDILTALKTDKGVEFVVVTVKSRSEWGESASLAEAAADLFNAWGIGDDERKDGILLLVAGSDREMQVTLGEGYPGTYDWLTEDIVDETILPYLRTNRLPEGIQAGTIAIRDRIAIPFAEGRPPEARPVAAVQPAPTGPSGPLWPWLAGLVAVIGGGVVVARVAQARKQCPDCNKRGKMVSSSQVLTEATLDKGGLVRITETCGWCNASHSRDEATPRLPRKVEMGGGTTKGGGSGGSW